MKNDQFYSNCLNEPYRMLSTREFSFNGLSNHVESIRAKSFSDGYFSDVYYQSLREHILFAEELLEKKMVKEYLLGNVDKLERRLNGINSTYYTAEAEYLAQFGESVFFIGCGAFPNTAIRYFCDYNIKTICIDYDKESVLLAEALINKRFGSKVASKYFEFIYADATDFDFSDKNINIFAIAGHCPQKNKIVDNILNHKYSECLILARNSRSFYKHFYTKLDLNTLSTRYNITVEHPVSAQSQMLEEPTVIKSTGAFIDSRSLMCEQI